MFSVVFVCACMCMCDQNTAIYTLTSWVSLWKRCTILAHSLHVCCQLFAKSIENAIPQVSNSRNWLPRDTMFFFRNISLVQRFIVKSGEVLWQHLVVGGSHCSGGNAELWRRFTGLRVSRDIEKNYFIEQHFGSKAFFGLPKEKVNCNAFIEKPSNPFTPPVSL